jgi:hypothetical protein
MLSTEVSVGQPAHRRSSPPLAWRRRRPSRLRRRPLHLAQDDGAPRQDAVRSLAAGGFREIILVNGHYTNVIALSAAIMESATAPEGTIAFPFNYWDALPPDELEAYLSAEAGCTRTSARPPR